MAQKSRSKFLHGAIPAKTGQKSWYCIAIVTIPAKTALKSWYCPETVSHIALKCTKKL